MHARSIASLAALALTVRTRLCLERKIDKSIAAASAAVRAQHSGALARGAAPVVFCHHGNLTFNAF
jgi:hypothetical protein